jgi:hypothetical protein
VEAKGASILSLLNNLQKEEPKKEDTLKHQNHQPRQRST